MNAKEQAAIEKWSKRNTVRKDLANATFEDILDIGAEVDPHHDRVSCLDDDRKSSLDAAIEQILDYGTRDDILAAINKVGGYYYLRGKYDSMMNLMVKL